MLFLGSPEAPLKDITKEEMLLSIHFANIMKFLNIL